MQPQKVFEGFKKISNPKNVLNTAAVAYVAFRING